MLESLLLIAALLIELFLFGLLIFLAQFLYLGFKGPPWVRTPSHIADAMLECAGIQAGNRIVDFGSGDGTLVLRAAKKYGASGIGLEWMKSLVWFSRFRAKWLGIQDRALFQRVNFFELSNYPPAEIITSYLFSHTNGKLLKLIKQRYPAGTKIVSRVFVFSDLTPVKVDTVGKEKIYVYEL